MVYDVNDRLTQVNSQNTAFDLDGNLTSCVLGGSAVSFAYDSGNRLTQAGNTAYGYDAQNNRVSLTVGTQTTQYVCDPVSDKLSRLLVSTDTSSNSTYYVYGIGLISHQNASGYSIYHFDLRGSTVALTDVNGAVTDRYTYGAYGELLTHTGTSETPFLYCGQDGVMKDVNGLYYMRARYYAPEIKRFLNVDPKKGSLLDSKALNNYGYVSGNPISNIDPEGMILWWLAAALVGAVVGVASTFVSDVVANIATGGKAGFGSLETYVGSAVGGAVEGVVTVVAGPVRRNSNKSIYEGVITKLKNGTAQHMSLETARKGFSAGMLNYEALYDGGKKAIEYYYSEYESNKRKQAYSYK